MNKLSRARRVLTEEGVTSLIKKTSGYAVERTYLNYLQLIGEYELSINGTEVSFSAPNETVVKRNRGRFSSENEMISSVIENLNNNSIFYDIGANTGIYTLFAAKNCNKVLSFEPYPPNYELLKNDISRNGVSNVEIYELALSDSNGKISFNQPKEDDIGYGSSSIVSGNVDNSIEVATRTGDSLVSEQDLPIPDVVKIDVEGAEPVVIDGMEDTLSDPTCQSIYCEVHTKQVDHRPSIYDFNMNLKDVKSKIQQYGFKIENTRDRGGEVMIYAHK